MEASAVQMPLPEDDFAYFQAGLIRGGLMLVIFSECFLLLARWKRIAPAASRWIGGPVTRRNVYTDTLPIGVAGFLGGMGNAKRNTAVQQDQDLSEIRHTVSELSSLFKHPHFFCNQLDPRNWPSPSSFGYNLREMGIGEKLRFCRDHVWISHASADTFGKLLRPELDSGNLSQHDYDNVVSILARQVDEMPFAYFSLVICLAGLAVPALPIRERVSRSPRFLWILPGVTFLVGVPIMGAALLEAYQGHYNYFEFEDKAAVAAVLKRRLSLVVTQRSSQ